MGTAALYPVLNENQALNELTMSLKCFMHSLGWTDPVELFCAFELKEDLSIEIIFSRINLARKYP